MVLILLLLGCSKKESKKEINGKYGGELKVVLYDNPADLDPRTYYDAASYKVIEQIYSPLFHFDSTGLMEPIVADSFDVVDGMEYYVFLKKGISFHDGKPLTAADVAYTYQWVKDNSAIANTPIINKFRLSAPNAKAGDIDNAIMILYIKKDDDIFNLFIIIETLKLNNYLICCN